MNKIKIQQKHNDGVSVDILKYWRLISMNGDNNYREQLSASKLRKITEIVWKVRKH